MYIKISLNQYIGQNGQTDWFIQESVNKAEKLTKNKNSHETTKQVRGSNFNFPKQLEPEP